MRRRSTIAFLMCLPLIVIITSLVLYPALYSIYLSMLNKSQTRFIGLGNFSFLLSRDVFWMVMEQTAIFALSAVFFKALIGLVTAHLINNLPAGLIAHSVLATGAPVPPAACRAMACGGLESPSPRWRSSPASPGPATTGGPWDATSRPQTTPMSAAT